VNRTEISATEIRISINNQVANVEIKVSNLPGKPAEVAHEASGKVYQYMEINKTNLDEGNIGHASVRFRIERSWIYENRINESTIALSRYENSTWKDLPTRKMSDNGTFCMYEAETPGFSVFAVRGDISFSEAPVDQPACSGNGTRCYGDFLQRCENGEWVPTEKCALGCSEGACRSMSVQEILIIIGAFAAGAAVVLLWKFRRKIMFREKSIDAEELYDRLDKS
jgi:PGF-pre-PGF domain-containing protein